MKKPERTKLTCKGNVPAKLLAKGVDSAKLYHYTQALEQADCHEAVALLEQAASLLVTAINESGIGAVNNKVHGDTYMDNYQAQLVADLTDTLLGTASQGRAFKQTVCDNTDATLDDFSSDGKAKAVVAPEDDPFADIG